MSEHDTSRHVVSHERFEALKSEYCHRCGIDLPAGHEHNLDRDLGSDQPD